MIDTWSTALPDWEKRIVAGESLMPCKPLNQDVADIALKIFDSLILVDIIGRPTAGEVTREWAREFIAAIFGAYDTESQERLITEFFLLISKKNTKSTLAAGIMMIALVLNERFSASLAIIAPTKEVANASYGPASDMIAADPELSAIFSVSDHTRTITHLGTNSTLKVYAAESDTLGGSKFSYVLIDELWLFGKRANAASMLREATGGLASRPEGFVVYLSTMPDEQPAGIFKQKLDYARAVRDGKTVDPQFLGLLYEFPQKYIDDELYLDPENWYMTNPNLGASVSNKFLAREFKKAQDEGKEELQDFTAKHLNVQIGISMRANRWAAVEFWEAAAAPLPFTLEELIEASEVITIGIDGGGLDDLLGFAAVGRLPIVLREYEDSITKKTVQIKPWWVWTRAWCHKIALERRKSIAPTLEGFAKDGDLIIVENIGDETEQVAQLCKQVEDSGKLDQIGLDPLGIGTLIEELDAVEIPSDKIIGVSQGFKMSGYIKTSEIKIAKKQLIHASQPLMTWSVGNARTVVRGSGTMISKAESGTAKIDPVIGMLNAVALMSLNPEPPKTGAPTMFFV
ncbi:terminase large subunit [Psychrobacter sp. 72-O-c]|uniref:terminase large subunit n=1 Tax=Psychrobacter sp. 72-O-c TaxID=2774125 RepID=UPI0019184D76|nr:terminase TerL endonuclease subunit [Psychrobacter sp. 72-O-c]